MAAAVAARISHAAGIKTGVETSTVLYLLLALALDRHHGAVIDPTAHAAGAISIARGLQGQQGTAYQSTGNG